MEEKPQSKKQRKEMVFSGVCLRGLLLWSLMGLLPCITSQVQEMFLNSLANCAHNDYTEPDHKVDSNSMYNVKDDVSPNSKTTTFLKNCQMVFRSISSDGRLCIFQHILDFKNDNMNLLFYDGQESVEGKTEPDVKVNRDHDMPGVEWCTAGRFLTVELAPRDYQASVKDVDIDIMVYHISSKDRKAYLDTSPSCGSVYSLDNSQVTVTNMDLNHKSTEIHSMCSLDFKYVGRNKNRTVCVVFEPRDNSGGGKGKCGFNYTLMVETRESEPRQVLLIESRCERPRPERWCSNTTKIRLTLTRNPGQEFEKNMLFEALVLDHEGDPSTLPLLFQETDESLASTYTTIIVLCVVLGLLMLGIMIFIFVLVRRRRHQAGSRSPKRSCGEASNGKPEQENLYKQGLHHTKA